MIEFLDDVITTLVLTLPQMSGYVKTSKNKDGDKDNNNNNKNDKLMSFLTVDDKLLEK